MKKLSKLITALLVYISRLGILPANFSPLGSFGFFSKNPVWFFAVILIFDTFHGGFYQGFMFTYLGFFAYWVLGRLAKNKKSKALFLPIASFSFFLISNFGVWLSWYPRTFEGLIQCYVLALPFYQNTFLGDLFFGYSVLFYKNVLNTISKMLKPLPSLVGWYNQ